jgi:hypothetical protein
MSNTTQFTSPPVRALLSATIATDFVLSGTRDQRNGGLPAEVRLRNHWQQVASATRLHARLFEINSPGAAGLAKAA